MLAFLSMLIILKVDSAVGKCSSGQTKNVLLLPDQFEINVSCVHCILRMHCSKFLVKQYKQSFRRLFHVFFFISPRCCLLRLDTRSVSEG